MHRLGVRKGKGWFRSFFISVFTFQISLVAGQNLIFDDDFNNFNLSKWNHLITGWRGGNREFEYYTNRTENSYVKNGTLFLQPTLTAARFNISFLYNGTLDLMKEGCNFDTGNDCVLKAGVDIINPIQSARIRTIKSFSFLYGTVEIRAKMPQGDWIWPAIWLVPTSSVYGGWPTSGEIDMVEIRGNTNLKCPSQGDVGNTRMYSTLHWGLSRTTDQYKKTGWTRTLENGSYSSDFHIYRLEWTKTNITFKVDNQIVGSITPPDGGFWQLSGLNGTNPWSSGTKMAPFDQKFHIIMNVAVGGNFFSDSCTNLPFSKPWKYSSPTMMRDFWEKRCQWYPTWKNSSQSSAMQVDYVRVWSL